MQPASRTPALHGDDAGRDLIPFQRATERTSEKVRSNAHLVHQLRPCRRRNVTFTNSMRVKLIESHKDYTHSEKTSYWTSVDDKERIEDDMIACIRYVRGRGTSNGDGAERNAELCGRGLEHMKSTAHVERRAAHKKRVLKAVLREQRQQRLEDGGRTDPDGMRKASAKISVQASELAQALGQADAAFVRAENRKMRLTLGNNRRRPGQGRALEAAERILKSTTPSPTSTTAASTASSSKAPPDRSSPLTSLPTSGGDGGKNRCKPSSSSSLSSIGKATLCLPAGGFLTSLASEQVPADKKLASSSSAASHQGHRRSGSNDSVQSHGSCGQAA